MKNKKLLIVFTLIAVGAAYLIGSQLYKFKSAQQLEQKAQENTKLFLPEHAARMGAENAQVTLVEFLDPECESCRRFYPFVKSLMDKYAGKIQLVLRYAPFHQNSEFAIRVLEAARMQDKYWETLEILFKYQPHWGSHHDPKPELIWTFLPELNLDIDQLKKDMDAPRITALLKQDIQDGRELGVRATPTFFVNSKPLVSFGFDQLEEAVQKELAQ